MIILYGNLYLLQMQHVRFDPPSSLFQLTIHPPISLIRDEQDNDVSLVKAEQCAVVVSSVRKYGAHAWLLPHIVETRRNRHRPAEIALLAVPVV